MKNPIDFFYEQPEFVSIFVLMLSTFFIGYFSSLWLQRNKYRSIVSQLKKDNAQLRKDAHQQINHESVNDIETIFTEIKPKIIKVVKEAQEEIKEAQNLKRVALKARTSYVTYNKTKPTLNFDSFGVATNAERDDLTKVSGVGPYIEQKLNEIGIYNYDQLSKLQDPDIRVITELIDFFPGRIERDDWIGQAEALKES